MNKKQSQPKRQFHNKLLDLSKAFEETTKLHQFLPVIHLFCEFIVWHTPCQSLEELTGKSPQLEFNRYLANGTVGLDTELSKPFVEEALKTFLKFLEKNGSLNPSQQHH